MKNITLPLASALLVLSASPMMGRAATRPASLEQKPETQLKIFIG